jgi:xanthine dehydrogenase YagS FAD-binding subunit
MKAFEWANAATADDAVKLLKPADPAADPDEQSRPMGGGQDLLTTMKAYIERPPRVVNLETIQGLNKIQDDGKGGLRIGATVTINDLEENPEVIAKYPGLAEAAAAIATPQIRNVGTVGGNLCQRPRCWYFRMEDVQCLKKGGTTCYAAEGQNKYNAIFDTGPSKVVHPSDLAPMLTALGATLTIQGPTGTKSVPIQDFFVTPKQNLRKENSLADGEIITEIQVPATTMKSTYIKFKERESLDFALSSVAAALEVSGGVVRQARLVLGGVASMPWRLPAVDQFLVGKTLNDTTLQQAATLAMEGAKPLEHNGYKVPLTQALLRRALAKFA